MKLNHLNLTVSDITAAQHFLNTYFNLQIMPWGTGDMAFLKDDDGMIISLMKAPSEGEISYPGMFHVGFIQENREQVDAINTRMQHDGLSVKPAREFHGSYTFYIKAPGGFTVEVLC